MNLPFKDMGELLAAKQTGGQETLLGRGGFSHVILVTK